MQGEEGAASAVGALIPQVDLSAQSYSPKTKVYFTTKFYSYGSQRRDRKCKLCFSLELEI